MTKVQRAKIILARSISQSGSANATTMAQAGRVIHRLGLTWDEAAERMNLRP